MRTEESFNGISVLSLLDAISSVENVKELKIAGGFMNYGILEPAKNSVSKNYYIEKCCLQHSLFGEQSFSQTISRNLYLKKIQRYKKIKPL